MLILQTVFEELYDSNVGGIFQLLLLFFITEISLQISPFLKKSHLWLNDPIINKACNTHQ